VFILPAAHDARRPTPRMITHPFGTQ
jgi:hypothetical protein